MNDTIAHYESFLAVAECGSISGAAKQLYVTQPAISAEIALLERALKVRLFFRTNRGVRLTPEGQVLYDHVSKGFSFIRAGEEKLREVGGLRSGTLRIGASDMTLRFFLLDYIADFRQRYPDVHLQVLSNSTPKTVEALRAGQIDFGVISGPIEESEELEMVPVREIRDIFIASEDFEIAHQAVVEKSDLAEYPLIMLERATSTRRYVSAWLGEGFPEPAIELATSDLLMEFAERGIGVCAITEDFAREAIEAGRVVRLPLREEIPPRRFYVAYLKRLPVSAAARRMLDRLREVRLHD
jgi:DNA-binding transcriptional LysR family regulator